MSKYTRDDNRSMQLNPNNDRYWSSRYSLSDDYEEEEEGTYDYELTIEEENAKNKILINELSFKYAGKNILFKDNSIIEPHNPISKNLKNIVQETLTLKKEFNIKRSELRRFLLENVSPKKFEMRNNWCMRNIVEEDEGRYEKYDYLNWQKYESNNYIVFHFEKHYQGRLSFLNDIVENFEDVFK